MILNLFGPRLVIAGGKLAQSTIRRETAGRVMRLRVLEMASHGAATLALDALYEPDKNDIPAIFEKLFSG